MLFHLRKETIHIYMNYKGKGRRGKNRRKRHINALVRLPFQISSALCHNKSCILLLSWGLCCNILRSLCFRAVFALNLRSSLSSCNNSVIFPCYFLAKHDQKHTFGEEILGEHCFGSWWLPESDSLLTVTNISRANVCSLLARFVMCFWFPASEMHVS